MLRIFDVEHGACAMLMPPVSSRLAMIDCGHNVSTNWRPSRYIRNELDRTIVNYLFLTNADQDHISDLNGLWENQINVETVYRNRTIDATYLRDLKQQNGSLTDDLERYLAIDAYYNGPISEPFDQFMDGVTCSIFKNAYPDFLNTNDLSLAVFFKFSNFKILFPGDLEDASWRALLADPTFREELAGTTIFVASHHGRWNGYCAEIFEHFTPQAIVISDKPIVHDTQDFPDYRYVVDLEGVVVHGQRRRRHVLTTRRDGDIIFKVHPDGRYEISTSKGNDQAATLLDVR